MEIRKLTPQNDISQYNDLLRYAFQVTSKQLLDYGWENEDIRQSKLPVLEKARVLGWFDGEHLASQFAVYPVKMNVHGHIRQIGFVTSVATYPEYTGRGLMSKLMFQSLEEMRQHGESLAILYPFSIPLYRYRGWEIISDKMTFRIKDSQLPKRIQVPGYVRRVDSESVDLKRLHNTFAAQTHGCFLRNELVWEEYWRWDVEDTSIAIYYDASDHPAGYMVYFLKENVMHIKEIVPLNAEAQTGLWRYIGAHESMVGEVVGNNYSNESIAFWLEDSDILETIRPYMMGRIVDVEQFFDQYRFLAPGCKTTFTLRVSDPFLAWNNRDFTISVDESGFCKVIQDVSEQILELDIGTLTSMLFSYKRPTLLLRRGRVRGSESLALLLENIIPREKAYISDYM